MKKSIHLFFVLAFLLIGVSSCQEQEEEQDINHNELTLSNLDDMELNLNLGETPYLVYKTEKHESFINNHLSDFTSIDEDDVNFYMKYTENYVIFKGDKQQNIDKQTTATRLPDEDKMFQSTVNCKTCKNEGCVKKTIADAVGDGTETVYLRIKPVRKLGIRVGVEVCWSDTPIEAQMAPLERLTFDEEITLPGPDNLDIVDISTLIN